MGSVIKVLQYFTGRGQANSMILKNINLIFIHKV